MPIVPVNDLASIGIITDQLPMQLPPAGWSNGRNVRFTDNKVSKFTGHEEFFDSSADTNWDGGSADQVYYTIPYNDGTDAYWVYCGLKDVRVTNGTASKEITNVADFSATAKQNWTGGILSTFLILNNGVDEPQSWTGDYATPAVLVDLVNFASQADKCGAMRVYKNYIVALDVTKSGTRYRSLVKWSDSAALGALPGSWDADDATTDAGETDLSEKLKDVNIGACIDCLPLRDTNIIYTDSQTWAMDFIGGTFVFNFRQIFKNNGILTRRCVQEFEGKHFVVGNSDVYVHDGSVLKSVIDSKNKKFLFSDMDGSNYETTYVFANYEQTEMWICYPQIGSATPLPTVALVWNWRNNAWGRRDLINTATHGTPHISSGIVDTSVTDDTWDTGTRGGLTWDNATSIWDILGFSPQEQSPLLAADKLYKGDSTNAFDTVAFESSIQRTDLPLGEQDQVFRIKSFYPKISGNAALNIHVGSQMAPGGTVDWGSPVSFTPGTDVKIDVRKTGTHAAVKFESSGDQNWELVGYEIEAEPISKR
jgi:hypothetical protein